MAISLSNLFSSLGRALTKAGIFTFLPNLSGALPSPPRFHPFRELFQMKGPQAEVFPSLPGVCCAITPQRRVASVPHVLVLQINCGRKEGFPRGFLRPACASGGESLVEQKPFPPGFLPLYLAEKLFYCLCWICLLVSCFFPLQLGCSLQCSRHFFTSVL